MINFEISRTFSVSANALYKAWLNSEQHSEMTGGEAQCSNQEADSFTAWDGYISGVNLELIPNRRIVQHWRTVEFKDSDEYSMLEIEFQPINGGTILKLRHSKIPDGQPDYEKGWIDSYFDPMTQYFNS
ncbi:MAG: hypothetical protein Salg2KO_06820 [Salibacteraceae bacterium]